MSKALLRQHAEKAIKEREQQEKAIVKKLQESSPVIQPQLSTTPPTPIVLNQTIVLPNNNASDIAKAKLKAEQLRLENERIAREKEALERENAAMKLKHELALKEAQEKATQVQARQDIEDQHQRDQVATVKKETVLSERRHSLALEENEQLVRKISQENDSLKAELAQLRSDNAEKKVPGEVLTQVLDAEETALVAPPPVYVDDAIVAHNTSDEVVLMADGDDLGNTYCVVS